MLYIDTMYNKIYLYRITLVQRHFLGLLTLMIHVLMKCYVIVIWGWILRLYIALKIPASTEGKIRFSSTRDRCFEEIIQQHVLLEPY